LRAGRREVKKAPRLACHFKAESLRPTTPPRGPARPTQAAAPIGSQAARLRPRSPQARPHRTIPQAAGTGSALPPPPLSRLHAERAVAAPAFAADRSEFREFQSLFELTTANRLSWPYKPCLASSGGRSISLAVSSRVLTACRSVGLLRSKTAHDAPVWVSAARSRPAVNGRTERRTIEAASSRRRWTLGPPRWIAAGALVLPLSGALWARAARRQRARRFTKSSLLARHGL